MNFLIEFFLISLVLYAYYRGLLIRQSWLQVNRAYLLLLLPLAACLAWVEWPSVPGWGLIPTLDLAPVLIGENGTPDAFSGVEAGWVWGLCLYGTGVVVSLGLLAWRLFQLSRYIARSEVKDCGSYSLVYTDAAWSPATFFRYIFWNPALTEANLKPILDHELCHVLQRHSLDLLILGLFQSVLWFFPLVYLIRRDLVQTHEFLADQAATRQVDVHVYAELLLQKRLGAGLALAHSIYHSPLKPRIFMLTKPLSKWTSWRYLGLLPLMTLVLLFACQTEAEETASMKLTEGAERAVPVQIEGTQPDSKELVLVDAEPRPLNLAQIQQMIGYPDAAKKENLQGLVVVRVLVGQEGEYLRHEVIKDPTPILTQEVEKYLPALKMAPATKDGKPVNFWINVPFHFKLAP